MPYIQKKEREKYDRILEKIFELSKTEGFGIWAKVLVGFCYGISPSYNSYKNFLGEITESTMEIVRRFDIHMDEICFVDRSLVKPLTEAEHIESVLFDMKAKVKVDGDLNYMLFAFAKRFVPRYMLNHYVGMLLEIVKVLRSQVLAELENTKIRDNGDVV